MEKKIPKKDWRESTAVETCSSRRLYLIMVIYHGGATGWSDSVSAWLRLKPSRFDIRHVYVLYNNDACACIPHLKLKNLLKINAIKTQTIMLLLLYRSWFVGRKHCRCAISMGCVRLFAWLLCLATYQNFYTLKIKYCMWKWHVWAVFLFSNSHINSSSMF